jgi:hypothetical protein
MTLTPEEKEEYKELDSQKRKILKILNMNGGSEVKIFGSKS